MSRPIRLTSNVIDTIVSEIRAKLEGQKLFDGKIEYNESFSYKVKASATVQFTPDAYAKMLSLIMTTDDEVAWNGVCKRDAEEPNKFIVSDILVYPQYVTGATVNTDQEEYSEWLYSFDDETFNNIRMQGHSHVNMSTSPSAVDLTHQEKILEQLDSDMFYVFMIWNKKLERTIKIFDLANNVLYEDSDVEVSVGDWNPDAFIKESKAKVTKKYYYSSAASGSKTGKKSAKAKAAYASDEDDDTDIWGGYFYGSK